MELIRLSCVHARGARPLLGDSVGSPGLSLIGALRLWAGRPNPARPLRCRRLSLPTLFQPFSWLPHWFRARGWGLSPLWGLFIEVKGSSSEAVCPRRRWGVLFFGGVVIKAVGARAWFFVFCFHVLGRWKPCYTRARRVLFVHFPGFIVHFPG